MRSPVAIDSTTAFQPEQQVLHAGRRATFLHMSGGVAIIRHWGDSHAVGVPPETLSLANRPRWRRPPLAATDEPLARDAD